MDRIALSKRIGGLADVFANGTAIRRELEAMSYALEHMQDERFASILNAGYEADDKDARLLVPTTPLSKPTFAISQRAEAQRKFNNQDIVYLEDLVSKDPKAKATLEALKQKAGIPSGSTTPTNLEANEQASISEKVSTEVGHWNRDASEAVMRTLVEDVLGKEAMEKVVCCDTGRKLEKEQRPDARKKQVVPSTLTEDQTPNLSESLESNMYEESQGAVRKEAGKKSHDAQPESAKPDGSDEEKSVARQQADQRAQAEAKKTRQRAIEKAEETAEALKSLDKKMNKEASDNSDMMVFDGVELSSPMMEVELTDSDVKTLSKLFG